MDFRTAVKWLTMFKCESGVLVQCGNKYWYLMMDSVCFGRDIDVVDVKTLKEAKEEGWDLHHVHLSKFDPKNPAAYIDEIIEKLDYDKVYTEFTTYYGKISSSGTKPMDQRQFAKYKARTAVKYAALRLFLETRLFGFMKVVTKPESNEVFWIAYQTDLSDTDRLNTFVPNKLTEPYFQSAVDKEDFIVLTVDYEPNEELLEREGFIAYDMLLNRSSVQAGLIASLAFAWATNMISEWTFFKVQEFKNRSN